MNIKGYDSVSEASDSRSCASELDVGGSTTAKADSPSSGRTEYTASNEGIEVEAIEFDKDIFSGCPKRLLLFIFAFAVILTASAATGFGVLRSKKRSASAIALTSNEPTELFNMTNDEINAGESVIPVDSEETESLKVGATSAPTDSGLSVWSDNFEEAKESESVPIPVAAEVLPGNGNISITSTTGTTSTSEASTTSDSLWSDAPSLCPNHNLEVASSCSLGSASSISTASFCFGSKRDGDWYWIRSIVTSGDGTAAAYDSWDYTEETQGELTVLDLAEGNYIISLVRDSMEPYDELISRAFNVPDCR